MPIKTDPVRALQRMCRDLNRLRNLPKSSRQDQLIQFIDKAMWELLKSYGGTTFRDDTFKDDLTVRSE